MAYLSHFLWNNRIEWAQVVRSNFLKLPSAKISLDAKRENHLLQHSTYLQWGFLPDFGRIFHQRNKTLNLSLAIQQKSRLVANL